MKKTYLILSCLMALAVTTTSCDDFLDVHPKGEQVEDDQFKDSKGFEDAIYGVYGSITDNNLYGMNLVWGITEVLAQNLQCTQTSMNDYLAKYDYKNNSEVRDRFLNIWTKAYQSIGYTNNVIQNLDKRSPESMDMYNLYKGEMLAVRAMLHFDLLRLFASTDESKTGIPYVKTFDFSVKPFYTVGECYDLIIADLTEAESLMQDQEVLVYPRDDNRYDRFLNWRETHMNLYAVKALLARVYWYKGDMVKAGNYASDVIESRRFPLVDETEVQDYIAGVLSPKETIFGLYSTTYIDFATSYLYSYQTRHSYTAYDNISGTTWLLPWQDIYNQDLPGTQQDFRKNQFRQENGITKCLKLVDYLTIQNSNISARPELISGISLINISEMYLIAAEALLDSNYPKALEYFNEEISSRGLTPLPTHETLTFERIYNEYRKEMFCMGQQWFNMKRLKREIISNVEARTIPASDNIYVLPIPEEEFEYRPDEEDKK